MTGAVVVILAAGTLIGVRTAGSHSPQTGPTPVASASATASGVAARSHTGTPSATRSPGVPAAVTNLQMARYDASTYTLSWAAGDSTDTSLYEVNIDGTRVTRTGSTSITLAWPSSTSQIMVRVAAVSARGLYSDWAALAVVPPPFPGQHGVGAPGAARH